MTPARTFITVTGRFGYTHWTQVAAGSYRPAVITGWIICLAALSLAGCAADRPASRPLPTRQTQALTQSAQQVKRHLPQTADCAFTPSHGTVDGQTVPPSYACIRLTPRQYALGQCREVSGYERDDGIFMPGHTRCLIDPLSPEFAVHAMPQPASSGPPATPAPRPVSSARAVRQPEPGNELILPTDVPHGIDQGHDTFVSPIGNPARLENIPRR
ncbi:MAG: hypothetical protein Q4B13_09510 [Lautropia sp.]|nr:hypothetical protein [Lautropia sp.]